MTVETSSPVCDLCARVQSPGVDCCAPDDASPIERDRDAKDGTDALLLRLVVILAGVLLPLAILAAVTGWQPWGAPTAPVAPVAVPAVAPAAPVALCDTDRHCDALGAALDERAGHVPAVAYGPASDGGVALSCPDGWAVAGTSVLDARCVPASVLLDA